MDPNGKMLIVPQIIILPGFSVDQMSLSGLLAQTHAGIICVNPRFNLVESGINTGNSSLDDVLTADPLT